jgi:hypothetical protein
MFCVDFEHLILRTPPKAACLEGIIQNATQANIFLDGF